MTGAKADRTPQEGQHLSTDDKLSKVRWNAQSEDGQVLLSLPREVFVLGLAVLSIVNLGIALIVREPSLHQVVVVMDSIIILVFVADLLRRLNLATNNRRYFRRGLRLGRRHQHHRRGGCIRDADGLPGHDLARAQRRRRGADRGRERHVRT
jgi:hypothetical protein